MAAPATVTAALSLLAGVLLGLASARTPPVCWLWAAGIALLSVAVTPWRKIRAARCLAALLAGMLLAYAQTRTWQALRITPASVDSRVLLEGTIVNVPARAGLELRFDADVRIIDGPGARDHRPRRARLLWRDPSLEAPFMASAGGPAEPRVGERWRFLARLLPAGETSNFSGFDAERAAFRERVHLTGRILPAALNTRLAPAGASIDGVRARIAARISERVADPDAAGLISALAVGLTAGVSADQWRVFNATGTTHLVAISGLHVTLFALLAFGAARVLWRWLPAAGRLAREPFALLLGLLAAGGYSLLAGFSVPTQRTWLMLAVFVLARLCVRHVSAAHTWSLALGVVLLCDAFAPLAAGFWLSFIAVGVILLLDHTVLAPPSRTWRLLHSQLAIMLALAPLTLAVFGSVSLVGLGVNLLAIPVISFVFVPLVLAGAFAAWWWPALDGIPFGVAAALYDWLWPGLVWAADVDFAQWRCVPPLWWYALAGPAALLLLTRWPIAMRLTAAGVALPLFCAPSRLPEPGTAVVQVLDAGRGSAVLVATHSRVLVFDTGDTWNTHGMRAAQVLIPALDQLGQRRVDLLILPGLNADRARGAALLAAERGVERILVGGGWPGTSLAAVPCSDTRFRWDEVEFQTFATGAAGEYCVLRATIGAHSLLLAGDLDARAEGYLLSRLPPGALASEVTVLSRQASPLGSSAQWIDSNHAGLVIAAGGIAGAGSRARTIARWRGSGAQALDTREHGAIEFGFGTQGIVRLIAARNARYPFPWRRID